MLVACIEVSAGRADERLWLEARVNSRPVRLIFDTGADRVILFPEGARRLGLQVTESTPPPRPGSGEAAVGITEPCDLTFAGATVRTGLNVLQMPDYLHMQADGAVGWGALRRNIVRIDASSLAVTFLSEVPNEARSWLKFGIRTNSGFLFLKVHEGGSSNAVVLVDTGFSGGVALAPPNWREWRAAHPRQPATFDSYFMPGAGLVVTEELLARQLELGSLPLTDVPVTEANPAEVALGGEEYQASLGLTALKRLDLIVDGEHGIAYLRSKNTPAADYDYNRMGAVFVPPGADDDQLIAHVAVPSPASEAGIRDGDVLLKIDDLDVTKWRTRPGILPFSRFWSRPAGTRLGLTLQRKGAPYRTTVILRNFLRSNDKLT